MQKTYSPGTPVLCHTSIAGLRSRRRGLLYPIKPEPGSIGAPACGPRNGHRQECLCHNFFDFDTRLEKSGLCIFGVATLCLIGIGFGWPLGGPWVAQAWPKGHPWVELNKWLCLQRKLKKWRGGAKLSTDLTRMTRIGKNLHRGGAETRRPGKN
jgi:hypothetical protein